MNILVTGANGQLGKCIKDLSDDKHCWFFTTREELDITNPGMVKDFIEKNRPGLVINTAAFTAVDKAESEAGMAMAVNRDGVKNLISALPASCFFVQISTDYVFSGSAASPYSESEPVSPQTVYGRSKAEGEKIVLQHLKDKGFIIRTSWLYSEYGHNFVKTMLRLGREKNEISVVNDQYGKPTYARDLASAIMRLTEYIEEEKAIAGIYHFANKGITTWFGFAREIMETGGLACKVKPIPSGKYPTAAKRPAFSALNTDKFEANFNFVIRNRKEALTDCLKRMMQSGGR